MTVEVQVLETRIDAQEKALEKIEVALKEIVTRLDDIKEIMHKVNSLSSKDIEQDIKLNDLNNKIENLLMWRSLLIGGFLTASTIATIAISLYT